MLQRRFAAGLSLVLTLAMACAASAVVVQSIETDIAATGPEPDTSYAPVFSAGGPSGSDILEGKIPLLSNGDFFLTGSRGPSALTDGSVSTFYGAGLNEDIHAAYLSAGDGNSITYALGGVYDITSIVVYGGWGDGGRDAQHYELQYSTDGGRNYTALSAVDVNPGEQGVDVTPVSTRVAFTEDTLPNLAEDVTTLRVSFLAVENLWTGYTEIDVFGSLESIPGDADGNGVVNSLDFDLISASYGSVPSVAGADGDVNYDDIVDADDFFAWRAASAASVTGGNLSQSIPEPTSAALAVALCIAVGGVWVLRVRRYQFCVASLVAVYAIGLCARPANAQNVFDWNVASGDWGVDGNWIDDLGDPAFVPDADIDEVGHVNNGGTAFVDSNIPFDAGGIVLGDAADESGTLEIRSGGTLVVRTVQGNASVGSTVVGGEGTGNLIVLPGGNFETRSMFLGGNAASSITFGGAGVGTATVEVDLDAVFDRELRVIGDVDFNANLFTLGGSNVFIPELTSGASSALKAQGAIAVGGVLRPEYTGPTPTPGTTWKLFDAPSITGQFADVDTSDFPALPFGQVYEFQVVSDTGSVNGTTGQLAVEQKLVLNVDRNTGAVSIANGPAAANMLIYSIGSTLGGLSPGAWNSLQDQAISDWSESPANGSANQVSELKQTGTQNVTQGNDLQLGNLFVEPTAMEIGTELEDLTFEYFTESGEQVQGLVNYIGDKVYNNVVLSVDPATGEARFANESTISVNLVGYRITSDSGSLLSGNGDWLSLDDDDRAGGDWYEANPSANMIAELKPAGETGLGQGVGFGLGTPFDTTGTQDVTFQYLLQGEDDFRDGVVVYREIPDAIAGDYNNDGLVNLADYTVWRDSLGASVANGTGADGDGDGMITAGDYGVWKNNFGMALGALTSPSGQVASVPEPTCVSLMLLGVTGAIAVRLRKQATHL